MTENTGEPVTVTVEVIYLRGGALDNMRKVGISLLTDEVTFPDIFGNQYTYRRTTDTEGGETVFDYVEAV